MSIRKFRAARVSTVTANEHVGQFGDVFYDESTGQFRVSNGTTPGGTVVATALNLSNGTADVFLNNLTVNGTSTTINNIVSNNETTVTGVLTVTGNASFTGNTIFTGPSTFIGDVTEVGNLVIIGEAINNGPSIFNGSMDINGNVTLTGNSSITGNTFVTGPTTVTGLVTITGNSTQTGQAKFIIVTTSAIDAGIDITGNNQGLSQLPVNQGVMLHITGEENIESRLYNDSSNSYAGFIGRRYNGNMLSPTQVLANQEVSRYGANPYTSAGWQSTGIGQLRWYANENQTLTNRGGRAEFWNCATGSNVLVKTATIDATGLTVTGNVTAGNVISNTIGTLYGNVSGIVLTAAQPNITTVGTLTGLTVDGYGNGGGLTVQGNLRYDIAYGNGTATQLTNKSTPVTVNGRTGQITTNNASLAKGASVTFTVNNTFVTSVTDVPIVAIQSGATVDSYAISVTQVQVGSFNITLTNNGAGPLADTIIINFAVMRIS